MLDSRSLGAPLVEVLETRGVLNDGRKITYALGLGVDTYKGIKEVAHSGGTAGYQTFLARYPDKKLSVGALCNGFPPFSGDLVHSIVDEVLGPFPEAPKVADGVPMTEDQLKKFVGIWKNERSRNVNRIVLEKGELKLNNNPLKPRADGSFDLDVSVKMTFTQDKDGKPIKAEILNGDGSITRLTAQEQWKPAPADLAEFAGDWYSDEARATFTVAVEGDKPFIVQHPTLKLPLMPIYKDHFSSQGGFVVWVTRDTSGKLDKLHVTASRMRDMPFVRVK
jgi:hypothetical protein